MPRRMNDDPTATESRRRSGSPPRWRGRCALAALAAVAIAVAGGCGPPVAGDPPRRGGGRPGVVEVHTGTLVRRVLLTGELQAVRAQEVMVPRTPQWQVAIRWMVADGTAVAAGQRVLELDNSAVTSNLEERRLAARRAADSLERARAQALVNLLEREFAREQKRLTRDKAAIDADVPEALLSGREWQERRLALRRAEVELAKADDDLAAARRAAEADVEVARIELEKAQRQVEIAEAAIGALSVNAPAAGVLQVADHPWEGRKLQVGDVVWVGMPVLRLPDLDALQVEAVLFDVDDGSITVGAPARCTVDSYPEETLTGTVAAIAPVAQELRRGSQRRAFRVTVALERAETRRLLPGMSVKVEVEAERRDNAVLVPRPCLALAGTTTAVELVQGTPVSVRLGPCSAHECVVEEGLAAGARVRCAAGGVG